MAKLNVRLPDDVADRIQEMAAVAGRTASDVARRILTGAEPAVKASKNGRKVQRKRKATRKAKTPH